MKNVYIFWQNTRSTPTLKVKRKKKIKSQKKWVKCRELGCFEKREEAKEKRLKKTSK